MDNFSDVASSEEGEEDIPNQCLSQFTKVNISSHAFPSHCIAKVLASIDCFGLASPSHLVDVDDNFPDSFKILLADAVCSLLASQALHMRFQGHCGVLLRRVLLC